MKKTFIIPRLTVVLLADHDIIATSDGAQARLGFGGNDDGNGQAESRGSSWWDD